MHARISRHVLSLVSVSLIVAGCDDSAGRSSGAPTAPGSSLSTLVTAEPSDIAPEFVSSRFCRTLPPFRARLSVTIRHGQNRFVRLVRFDFTDRFGGRAIPTVIPTLGTTATLPNSMPVPLPTSSPIPIPGTLPLEGLAPGSRPVPVVLEFDCGVRAAGTLVISVETADRRGMSEISRTSVDIGR